MVKPSHSPNAFVALVATLVATSLGCASRAPKDTSPAPETLASTAPDTSTVLKTDGKTLEDLFTNKFPGVTINQADGGGLRIRIRGGGGNFTGSDEPLLVVDEAVQPTGSGGIVYINPHDIEKIEVLKNPADIALYGIRAGNGVVKITTRRPGRGGRKSSQAQLSTQAD